MASSNRNLWFLLTLFLLYFLQTKLTSVNAYLNYRYDLLSQAVNDRPIIGILSQESPPKLIKHGPTYIAASYIKYIESAGGRVVPIKINQTNDYYLKIFNSINGLLLPGGHNFYLGSGYGKAIIQLFKLALQANDRGDYFPIWGTCLGFEMLTLVVSGKDWRIKCLSYYEAIPLQLVKGYENSQLFSHMPAKYVHILSTDPVTINNHENCITPENFTISGLDKFFKVLSLNKDQNGTVFVSTVEAILYPFYGTQWHPEKNIFEWEVSKHIPHSAEAIEVIQYLADFFLNEARKSNHKFSTPEEERQFLIYKYNPVYTEQEIDFMQCYFFQV